MTEKKTGGPAFSENIYKRVGDMEEGKCNPGMTLRDYFAGKAMQAMIGMISANNTQDEINNVCESAYIWADDMIKERE